MGSLDISLPKKWNHKIKKDVIIEFMNRNRDKTVVILTPESQLLYTHWHLFTAYKVNQAKIICMGDISHEIIFLKKIWGKYRISKKIGGVKGKEIGDGWWGTGERRSEFPLRYPSAVKILVESCLSEFADGGDCGEFTVFFYRRGRD